MIDEITYEVECQVCDQESTVIVSELSELPCYCPLCGSPVTLED